MLDSVASGFGTLVSLLITLGAFVLALFILVSLHELGHFMVARLCGIKVLRFCIGFGKPFFMRKKGDTEWAIAPIPLGGYVKMVDTREGEEISPEDLPFAFDKQHPAKRIAVVVAGPLMNLLLAVLLFTLSFSMGITTVKPVVGMLEPNTIAARAGFVEGDTITSINGQKITDWGEAHSDFLLSGQKDINITVVGVNGQIRTLVIDAKKEADAIAALPDKLSIGIHPFKLTSVVGYVEKGMAADQAGIKTGDKIISTNGQPVTNWFTWKSLIENSPGAPLDLVYESQGKQYNKTVYLDSLQQSDGRLIGKIGLGFSSDKAWFESISEKTQPGFAGACVLGWSKTVDFAAKTVSFFGKMLTGQASLKYVSGPVAIADIAGKSAMDGLQSYLSFLGLISVSLGVLNLMPIPVLDGGHLVYYIIEWVRGKPLSLRVQELGFRFGLAAMLCLMLLAFFNDFTRYFG